MATYPRGLSAAVLVLAGLTLLATVSGRTPLPCDRNNFLCGNGETPEVNPADGLCQCCTTADSGTTCTEAVGLCSAELTAQRCRQCGQYGECTRCEGDLQVVNGTCQPCLGAGCDVCYPGNGYQCKACQNNHQFVNEFTCAFSPIDPGTRCGVDGCDQCYSGQASVCFRCLPWFTVDIFGVCNSQCNVKNCQSCYAADEDHCQLCSFDFVPQNNGAECVPRAGGCRVTHCKTCTGAAEQNGRCAECEVPYVKSNDGLCKPCNVSYCDKCQTGNPNVCQTCANGWRPVNGLCVPAACNVPACLLCSSENPDVCIGCVNETYELINGICREKGSGSGSQSPIPTPASCYVANCKACRPGNPRVCATCNAQYTVNAAGTCGVTGYCRVINCVSCMPGDAVRCQSCRRGYGLSTQGLCVALRKRKTTTTHSAAAVPPHTLVAAMLAVAVAAVCAVV